MLVLKNIEDTSLTLLKFDFIKKMIPKPTQIKYINILYLEIKFIVAYFNFTKVFITKPTNIKYI